MNGNGWDRGQGACGRAECQRRGHVQLAVALQPAVNRPCLPGIPPNGGPVYLLVFTNICRQSLREQFLAPEV